MKGQQILKFITLACINVVVAAHDGGAFPSFGEIITLMVWPKGRQHFAEFDVDQRSILAHPLRLEMMTIAIDRADHSEQILLAVLLGPVPHREFICLFHGVAGLLRRPCRSDRGSPHRLGTAETAHATASPGHEAPAPQDRARAVPKGARLTGRRSTAYRERGTWGRSDM